jgi:hypothetical protein
MADISADLVLNKNLYAKGTVLAYDLPNGKVVATFDNGGLVGNVYSWVTSNGIVYWMFNDKYGRPYYVKHDSNKLSLKELPAILKKIEDEQVAKEIESKGKLNYYLQKYLPWIVGAVVVAVAFPAIYKNVKK